MASWSSIMGTRTVAKIWFLYKSKQVLILYRWGIIFSIHHFVSKYKHGRRKN